MEILAEISCLNKKNHAFIAYSDLLKNLKRNNTLCEEVKMRLKETIADYGTVNEKVAEKISCKLLIKASDITLNIYSSIFEKGFLFK